MTDWLNQLSGKKTYITAGLAVAWGVTQIAVLHDVPGGVTTILGAMGLGSMRHAISKASGV